MNDTQNRYRFYARNCDKSAAQMLQEFAEMPQDFTVKMIVETIGQKAPRFEDASVEITFSTHLIWKGSSPTLKWLHSYVATHTPKSEKGFNVCGLFKLDDPHDHYTVYGAETWKEVLVSEPLM